MEDKYFCSVMVIYFSWCDINNEIILLIKTVASILYFHILYYINMYIVTNIFMTQLALSIQHQMGQQPRPECFLSLDCFLCPLGEVAPSLPALKTIQLYQAQSSDKLSPNLREDFKYYNFQRGLFQSLVLVESFKNL